MAYKYGVSGGVTIGNLNSKNQQQYEPDNGRKRSRVPILFWRGQPNFVGVFPFNTRVSKADSAMRNKRSLPPLSNVSNFEIILSSTIYI